MKTHSVIFYTAIFVMMPLNTIQRSPLYIPEDATLNFTELSMKYGMFVQEHDVITEDGYILKLFHIPGDSDKTVLLMHGLLGSADTFIIRGRGSLVAALASEGYDVWIGNYRGTTHSRRHKRLNPDTDNSFWDFSFHEIGAYDLPAIIDFILQENDVTQLSAIGHSQGNTIFYVLGSVRPEYNNKIKVLIALGPVCYLNVDNFQFPVTAVVKSGPVLKQVLLALNQEEVFGETSFLTYIRNTVCTQRVWGYRICAKGIFFQLAGEDEAEFEPDMFYKVIGHYPVGTSRQSVLHLMQIASEKEFMQFDYGPQRNLKLYNSKSPPVYDLKNVTMKIALLVGRNDKITPLGNVELLRKQLPNVVNYHVIEHPKFNHIDHVWGKNMHKYLFPHVMKLLNKFNKYYS